MGRLHESMMRHLSALYLEQQGKWRLVLIALIFGMTLFFPGLLIFPAFQTLNWRSLWPDSFTTAFLNSTYVIIGSAITAFIFGSIAGTIFGLYQFKGKSFFLLVYLLPFMVPPFLLAIGLDSFRLPIVSNQYWTLQGMPGIILSFSFQTISFVLFGTWLSTRTLSQGQVEVLRITRKERDTFFFILRQNLPLSALLAIFFSLLTIADPGPGQIFGRPGISTELLVSLSALYDFDLAALQSLLISLIVLSVSLLVIIGIKKYLDSNSLLEKGGRLLVPIELETPWPTTIATFLFLLQIIPVIGLLIPILWIDDKSFLLRALGEAATTFQNSILYSLGGASIAVGLGLILVLSVGRMKSLRSFFLVGLLSCFSIPSFLSSLGVIHLGTLAPAFMDWLTRSRFSVALILGLKFFPVASLILFYGYLKSPRSWAEQAAISSMTLHYFLIKVLLPWLKRHLVLSLLLISLLISSEINMVLLLRPPGEDSFPIRIFTVMANSSEAFVTSLCTIYLLGSLILLGITSFLLNFSRRVHGN